MLEWIGKIKQIGFQVTTEKAQVQAFVFEFEFDTQSYLCCPVVKSIESKYEGCLDETS